MNAFLSTLDSCGISKDDQILKRSNLTTLQVNMGNLCNQSCLHCHVGASPEGSRVMSKKVIEDIVCFLEKNKGLILDITGGAPELNPYFNYFIKKARPNADKIIVRSNLSVLFEPGKEYLPEFFKENKVHLICSLPCYGEKNVDSQRGSGVFKKSIKALKTLNSIGYAKGEELELDLVYNPNGAFLPPEQKKLQKEYAYHLKKDFDIDFGRLVTITNVPIKRFKDYLDSRGEYDKYIELLQDNFNPDVVGNIMCRKFLSVGYDGRVYDCDFNQSLGWKLKDKKGKALTIDKVTLEQLDNRDIMVGEHCLSCTAGYGSSCQGALEQESDAKEMVKEYYGKVLSSKKDLKTSACCAVESFPLYIKDISRKIYPEILDKFYGCGSPIPEALNGCTVLDLGCGTGRDVYIASYLVGEKGKVIGVDMTNEQLSVANKYREKQAKRFGFSRSNVEFKKGYIEDLKTIGIEDNSVDVVISNCVINLSFDKQKVFSEIFRVLKPGGELYFSDVFTSRRLPDELKNDQVLVGECIAGALYIEDFRRRLRELGRLDYRVVSSRGLKISDPLIKQKIGMTTLYSMTIRTFKLENLEDICEDYGQIAIYKGTIKDSAEAFHLDDQHVFIANKPMLICGNTAEMLTNTRFAKHFEIIGERSVHFGAFNCNPVVDKIKENESSFGGGCC